MEALDSKDSKDFAARALIRPLRQDEYAAVDRFTAMAVFTPPGAAAPAWEKLRDELGPYYRDFGRDGDQALAAYLGEELVGIAWARLFGPLEPGYGYLDEETPEVSLAVAPEWRRRGLGRALMLALLERLRETGQRQASLSVDLANTPARALYEKLGFVDLKQDAGSAVMLLRLEGRRPCM